MNKLYCRVIMFLAMVLLLAAVISAQTNAGRNTAEIGKSGVYVPIEKPYIEYAFELFLGRNQGQFLGTYIDPEGYMVGPGDEFLIAFVANDMSDIRTTVDAEGSLFVKSVGRIELGHIMLAEALTRITGKVGKIFSGTEFSVNLSGFRYCKINVIGKVKKPGIYYVPATWRVSEVIELAGGLTEDASQRNIAFSGFDKSYTIDLIAYNRIGSEANNVMICRGSTVNVPRRKDISDLVAISGQVVSPGVFEPIAGDRVDNLCEMAGGLTGAAEQLNVIVYSHDGTELKRFDGAVPEAFSYRPASGENIKIVWKEGFRKNGSVLIMGAISRPGAYNITKDHFSLNDLLQLCGGVAPSGSKEMIQVFRRRNVIADIAAAEDESKTTDQRVLVSYNPRDPKARDKMILFDDDSLFVPRATGAVEVSGAVASPGLVAYSVGKEVEYYIQAAGGLGYDADKQAAVVINRFTGGRISASDAGALFDGEILFIPQKQSGK